MVVGERVAAAAAAAAAAAVEGAGAGAGVRAGGLGGCVALVVFVFFMAWMMMSCGPECLVWDLVSEGPAWYSARTKREIWLRCGAVPNPGAGLSHSPGL
jgi:hypothetical protein